MLTKSQLKELPNLLSIFKDDEDEKSKKFFYIGTKIINKEEVTKDELKFVKLLIEIYQIKNRQNNRQAKLNKILREEKSRKRKLYDRQKYIIGGITIKALKHFAKSDNVREIRISAFLIDILESNLKESDIEIIKPIIDEIKKSIKENPSIYDDEGNIIV